LSRWGEGGRGGLKPGYQAFLRGGGEENGGGEGGITFSYIVTSSSPLPFTPHSPEKSDNQVTVTGDVSKLLE